MTPTFDENIEAARLRATWIPQAHGDVLEVGIGSGLNLAFYSSQVRRVYGVDPSVELQRVARRRMTAGSVPIDLFTQSAEAVLPLANASIDTAVMTWTLCSIANPSMALNEIKRVLKPNGRLIFLEHGLAPHSSGGRLAGSADAGMAAYRRRMPPQSQDRRTHHQGRLPTPATQDSLPSGTTANDLHLPRNRRASSVLNTRKGKQMKEAC